MRKKKLTKLRSGYYDVNAPKFRYVKDVLGFARKTSRTHKKDELKQNQESTAPSSKRSGSLYPWTKPLLGYRREFVGYGKWRSKGRQPRTKQGVVAKSIPSTRLKKGFSKYPRTYGFTGEM